MKIQMFVVDSDYFSELYFSRVKDTDNKPENGTWDDVYIYTSDWISKKCNVIRIEKMLGVKNINV